MFDLGSQTTVILVHAVALIAAFVLKSTVGSLIQFVSSVVLGVVSTGAIAAAQRLGASDNSIFFLGHLIYNCNIFLNFSISCFLQVIGGFAVFYIFDQKITAIFLLFLVGLLLLGTIAWSKLLENQLSTVNIIVCFAGGITGIGVGAGVVLS
jgi:hypothetical protein